MDLVIPDMSCKHCQAAVTKALVALDPAADVAVDLDSRKVAVRTAAAESDVIAALKAVGYEAQTA